tara:strand:- start:85 stop:393 length:309 start_codon:yes stop_codon:yes gene_type:complete
MFGRKHCFLCDITHGHLWKKDQWIQFVRQSDWPIELIHLDEQIEELMVFTEDRTPCVILETEQGYRELLDSRALKGCESDVSNFIEVLERSLRFIRFNIKGA